jgi:hypothetical protein
LIPYESVVVSLHVYNSAKSTEEVENVQVG